MPYGNYETDFEDYKDKCTPAIKDIRNATEKAQIVKDFRIKEFSGTLETEKLDGQTYIKDSMDRNDQDGVENNISTQKRGKQQRNVRRWLILFAGVITNAIAVGFPFNMSVLYIEWLQEFGRSNLETSIIQSVCTGTFFIGGFASGFLTTKYGTRKCGILAGIMATTGLLASTYATSIIYITLFLGIVSGFAFSLAYICASTTIGHHFNGKLRMLALAIMASGAGLGASVFPMLLEILIQEYGWRGTLWIMAGVEFQLVANASLYNVPRELKKLNEKLASHKRDEKSCLHKNDNCKIETISSGECNQTKEIAINIGLDDNMNSQTANMNCKAGKTEPHISYSDQLIIDNKHETSLDIFKVVVLDRIFLVYTFSIALSNSVMNAVLIFLIDYYQSKGISRSDALLIYLYMNISSLGFRVVPGLLKQLPHVSVLSIPAFNSLLGCIAIAILPFVGSLFTLNLIMACCFGISVGMMTTVMPVSTAKLVGPRHYSIGLGISMAVIGIFQILVGPIIGYIRDLTGNYDTSLFCTAAALFLSSVLFFVIMVYRHWMNRDILSPFEFVITVIRRKSRRRSSILPWRKRSVEILQTNL